MKECYNPRAEFVNIFDRTVPAHTKHVESAESDYKERPSPDHGRIWYDERSHHGQYDSSAGGLGADGHADRAVFLPRIFEGGSGRFLLGEKG